MPCWVAIVDLVFTRLKIWGFKCDHIKSYNYTGPHIWFYINSLHVLWNQRYSNDVQALIIKVNCMQYRIPKKFIILDLSGVHSCLVGNRLNRPVLYLPFGAWFPSSYHFWILIRSMHNGCPINKYNAQSHNVCKYYPWLCSFSVEVTQNALETDH